jgi:hypothetical protein
METIGEKAEENRLLGSVFILGTANSACSVAFYARISGIRANPLKYTDPDGNETLGASMTEDDYNNHKFNFPSEYRDWDAIQEFFKDNPNGAFYGHDSELMLNAYKDKKDIKYINPDKANVDLLCLAMTTKAIFSIAKGGINTLGKFKNVDPKALTPNSLDEFSTIGPSDNVLSTAREIIKNTGSISSPISVAKGTDGALTIIDGHHRWLAAIQMGLKKVPIEIIEGLK